jgi:hypothetical protein
MGILAENDKYLLIIDKPTNLSALNRFVIKRGLSKLARPCKYQLTLNTANTHSG